MSVVHRTKAKRATSADGREFPSIAEARRWDELRMLERGGAISNLEPQPSFLVFDHGGAKITYTADFAYTDRSVFVVEEVKGLRTPDYLLRRKMFVAKYPNPLYEISGKKRLRVYLTPAGLCRTKDESARPKRAKRKM